MIIKVSIEEIKEFMKELKKAPVADTTDVKPIIKVGDKIISR